ncbi:MAG TPA: PRC-barrel domain-containing protein [Gaiellales bacterium]|jgi:sporulation protein YlmC with PRC-barrel domain|nr:PRC-barrel domain-containing protein [Gaiellales bacterium]
MPSPLEVQDWHELDVVSEDGQHVGKLVDVYVDNESGEPAFLLVSSGVLGHRLHLVPADNATRSGDEVRVPVSRDRIEGAPSIHADDDVSPDEERRLFEYYGREYTPHPEGLLVMRRFVLVQRRNQ